MYKSGSRRKTRLSASGVPLAVKGLALIFVLCAAVRLVSTLGAAADPDVYMSSLFSSSRFVSGVLDFELGSPEDADGGNSLAAFIFSSAVSPYQSSSLETVSEAAAPATPETVPDETDSSENGGLYYVLEDEPEAVSGDTVQEHIHNDTSDSFVTPDIVTETAEPSGLYINNHAGYDIDIAALLSEPLNITLSGDSPAVLIIHTHSSEAYMPDDGECYEASDSYRTQDKAYSVIRVGDELAAEFAKHGIAFIHDRNVYDYPSYQGSYSRSYESIVSYLEMYPSIKIVIDLHRDAIHSDDGTVYKTLAQVGEDTCAQVMLVMGTDSAGLNHPDWQENLKLALQLQNEMNTLYPSLAKPIWLSEYRYNQQATLGSMLVEIGCTGNTLAEALSAARYFADAASNVILGLYE